ncbi:hypothetical protein SARC_07157 [Sphaeroforma arctica JP610]|uniref:Uncharacterized protein n=1 Tax=Sphaeroforma arctica JP610 TaxID=667725 RepID=A0A0L0FUF2_9EUKA|nr:hypothetical protein SARC_07157 [Sphaeroforma arctica JP610]KNC80480.1 hypothetical protein SARC_07157 [Sphaeroforma arctica JP610]|eukprot:XP_014154382.1 hypothetical protein SARC_07157 [Sphaeroforma arctica JP610]
MPGELVLEESVNRAEREYEAHQARTVAVMTRTQRLRASAVDADVAAGEKPPVEEPVSLLTRAREQLAASEVVNSHILPVFGPRTEKEFLEDVQCGLNGIEVGGPVVMSVLRYTHELFSNVKSDRLIHLVKKLWGWTGLRAQCKHVRRSCGPRQEVSPILGQM